MTIDFIYVISLITEPHDISVKIKDLKMKTDTPFYVVPANIYQNLSITFISSVKKNQEIDNKIFKLPQNNWSSD